LSQEVVARCFEYELKRLNSPECYFNSISNEFIDKRDKLIKVLEECGMKPVVPDGGYFVIANYSHLGLFEIISRKILFDFLNSW
jgi:kynurenine--oxoglutarate transaminase/cysteine-S-conjugate beta-lyase/glutamine--phenylpyruvate transaminase